MLPVNSPLRRTDEAKGTPSERRTVIPTPRSNDMFPGWAYGSKSNPVSNVFLIDPHSGVPLYSQLIEQVKRAVALGTLLPGEQLPTVKALALDLTINANTVARAYRELERDRVIETSPGRGSFVRSEAGSADVKLAIEDVGARVLGDAVRETRSLGLDRATVRTLFERALERWFPGALSEDT